MAGEVSILSTGRAKPVVREPVVSAKSLFLRHALRSETASSRWHCAFRVWCRAVRGTARSHHAPSGMEFLPTLPAGPQNSRGMRLGVSLRGTVSRMVRTAGIGLRFPPPAALFTPAQAIGMQAHVGAAPVQHAFHRLFARLEVENAGTDDRVGHGWGSRCPIDGFCRLRSPRESPRLAGRISPMTFARSSGRHRDGSFSDRNRAVDRRCRDGRVTGGTPAGIRGRPFGGFGIRKFVPVRLAQADPAAVGARRSGVGSLR